ncbi:MAG TPA: Wzz/FepE/Etk N-terminal domain-containing protein [Prolixibacteraceae bacterium]|jgi:capsular polysaccharide biosynthesis protein
MTNFFNNQNLLEIIWKWKKHLIVVGILAIGFSIIFSSSVFIKPKFKSTARIYPSNNIYVFSEESQSEQLLEIISALDIKLRVIDAFDLATVYKISKQEPQYLTYMLSEFNDNVNFKKTEFETIEIQVLDTDPKRASQMCDSIISFLDQKVRSLHRIKYEEVAKIARKDYAFLSHQIDSVEEKLNYLRKEYQIIDYSTQAKELTKGMVKAISEQKTNTSGGKRLEKWMNNFIDKGGEYVLLDQQQKLLVVQRDDLKKTLDEAISNATKKIVYGLKIQNPVPADKKSYPSRMFIVLVSTLAALFVALLAILLLENKKND